MLGEKLREAIAKLTGKHYVDEQAVKSLIKDLQRVLIASDVNVKLVSELSKRIEERALKTEKKEALTLKEHVVKVVYDELVHLMGEGYLPRVDRHRVLLCGLYGSGKTTTAAKLAKFYKSRGLSVLLVGADVDRPAAQEQLRQLSEKVGARFFAETKSAAEITERALSTAKEDVVIVDSAGRSAFDEQLASELKAVYDALKPDEVFLVMSADIGQVAGKQAEEFGKIVPISGVIVTRMDGSGKGGGALSAVAATGAKIAFIGVGEKLEDFEVYKPDKFVGRLLGMPDIESLMEKIKQVAKEEEIKKLETEELTIETFYEQLKSAKKLGPLGNVFSMLGVSNVPKELIQQSEEKMKKYEAMINSMTKQEKKDPKLIRSSKTRLARIARGSGCSEADIREFLNQFEKVERMMKRFKHDRGFRAQMEKMMKGMAI
ncbi:MAG: signal recognition particle receptor subunit alpha [Candidatus Bilamarchaeaceae archaeon]